MDHFHPLHIHTKFWNSRSFFLLKMRKNPEMQLEKFKIHAKTQLDWFFIISLKKKISCTIFKKILNSTKKKKSAKKYGAVLWLYWCWQEYFKQFKKKSWQQGSIYSIYYKVYGWKKKHFSTFHSEIFFIQQHRQCAPNQINKKKQETHLQKIYSNSALI